MRRDRGRRVEVAAEIGVEDGAEAEDAAVWSKCELHVRVEPASLVGGEEVLGAILRPADRPAELECGGGDRGHLRAHRALAPEGAADVRDDHAEPVAVAGERVAELGEGAVRVLRRAPDREDVRAGIVARDRAPRLDRSGDEARDVERLADDCAGRRERTVHVTAVARPAHERILGHLVMEEGRRRRRTGIEHGLERLVVDLDELGPVLGERPGLGDDERDRLARVPHLSPREHRVTRVRNLSPSTPPTGSGAAPRSAPP